MQKRWYRLNQQIQAKEIRLLDSTGKQIGVVSKEEALKRAADEEVDLVEIAPNVEPRVCKLIDFKKFLYKEEKRKREEKKKAHVSETKEVRLGPFISDHDLQVKISRGKEFLLSGNKVKVVVRFTGRQMAHPEFGHKTMNNFLSAIAELSKIEKEPHQEGRFYWMIISPAKGSKKT